MDHHGNSEFNEELSGREYNETHGTENRAQTQQQLEEIRRETPVVTSDAQVDDSNTQMVGIWKMFCLADGWDINLMVLGLVGAVVKGLTVPAIFILFGRVVEAFGKSKNDDKALADGLFQIAIDYLYITGVSCVGGFFETACFVYSSERQSTRLRMKYLQAILTQEVGFFDTDANTASIISCITDNIIDFQDAMGEKIGHFFFNFTTALSSVVLALVLCWQLGLLVLVVLPVITVTGGFYNLALANLSTRTQQAYLEADNIVHETISQVRTVFSYVGEMRAVNEFSNALKDTVRLGSKGGFAKGVGLGTLNGTMNASWGLMFWLGAILVVNDQAKKVHVVISIFCIIYGGLCLGLAAPDVEAMGKGRRAAYPIFDIIDRVPKVRNAPDARDLGTVRGEIQILNVHFAYPARPDAKIFRGLSLKIPAGTSVALVGSSGSGNTTIVSLIGRFFDPSEGKILVDGQDITKISLQSLRSNIGLVGQEPALFTTTIYENILMGRPKATQEEVEAAARAANIHSFIMKLPEGYQTEVGDRGNQLSGGQKQRIAIARAVLKDPAILLLDEATSALDAESERVVQESLDDLMLGRTSVVVAHKLSTIRYVDHIAVLHNGQLIEWGSHNDLMLKGSDGAYFKLIQCQEGQSGSNETEKLSTSGAGPSSILQPPRQSLTRTNSGGRNFLLLAGGGDSPFLSFEGTTPTRRSVSDERRQSDYLTPRSSVSFSTSRNDISLGPSFEQGVLKASAAIRQADNSSAYKRLFRLLVPQWKRVTLGFLGSLTAGCVRPVFAVLMVQAATSLFKEESEIQQNVNKWALILACLGVYSVITSTLEHTFFVQAGEIITCKVREEVFQSTLRNEVGWFDFEENNSAHITHSLATDAAAINTAVSQQFSSFVNNVSSILFAIAIGFVYDWKMTLIAVAILPCWLVGGVVRYKATLGYAHILRVAHEQASDCAVQAVTNIRTVASFTLERRILDSMNEVLKKPLENGLRHAGKAGFANGAGFALAQFGNALSVFYLATATKSGKIDFIASFTVFQVMANTAAFLSELLSLVPQFSKVRDGINRVFDLINRRTEIDADKPGSKKPDFDLKGRIEFRGVHFNYPSRPDVRVLRDLNLQVDAGRTVALVGESGSGKSSCIALIERFYDVCAGKVLIDGLDIRDYNLRWLRRQISLVQQEPCLFRMSIKDNIAYGDEPQSSIAQVVEAAKAANADSFISALPAGYNTDVGDRGSLLSGGQKQRVAIARAILKNPKILLLDEATSALDVESERVVQNALDRLMRGRTTLVIAHRLSTIRNADLIVLMKGGRAVEYGSHDRLMSNKNGFYANLVASQTHQQEQPHHPDQ